VLVAVIVAALGVAFMRPTSEIEMQQGHFDGVESATADNAVVASRTKEDGFRMFGIGFGAPTYLLTVAFSAPAECAVVVAVAPSWPTGDPACGPDGDFAGEISGTGRTSEAAAYVAVRFEVDGRCFEAIDVGDTWPAPGCR
jgi:hypothetical protein